MSKAKLKDATNKAAKAIADLVKQVELYGHELSEVELGKVFIYLQVTVESAHKSALVAHKLSLASHGSFDFDMEITPPAPPQPRERYVRGAAPADTPQPDVDDDDGVVFLEDED